MACLPGVGFDLALHPPTSNRSLRAWDAADEYLLRHCIEDSLLSSGGPALVVNDEHGALALGLVRNGWAGSVTSWNDSWLAHQSLAANASRGGLDPTSIRALASTAAPASGPEHAGAHEAQASSTSWALVLIKVPKTLALLEDQLVRLRPHLSTSSTVVGAGMVKHVHRSTLGLFERCLGPTTTSLARKKARLIHPMLDIELEPMVDPPHPSDRIEENGVRLVEFAGIFAQGRLDVGTRFLLDHLPRPTGGADVVDLGCGNGILGITLARNALADGRPLGSVHFTDVSHHAVASARASWARNEGFGSEGTAVAGAVAFSVADGLVETASDSADLILNNPPFHEQQRLGDDTVWRMFTHAHRVLRTNGRLRVVANRHLGHHVKLRKIFGQCAVVASNNKFVVLEAVRSE